MKMTITEALAEIKTLEKRIASKRSYIAPYFFRMDGLKDPLEKDGGSAKVIKQEIQAIEDLELRLVDIRHSIQHANNTTAITVEGTERSITDWLIWRREVAPLRQRWLVNLSQELKQARDKATKAGSSYVPLDGKAEKPTDIIVSIDESWVAKEMEKMEIIWGNLDGQLSLKNATVMIG